jgi:predicted RND superfamily exporter protein
MITGVKRKFIEIVDSDDDTTTVYTESESEYEPENEDEIDDLKNDLHESEQSNDALINIIIKERETSNALQAELTELKEKYNKLVNSVKEVQNSAWYDFVCLSALLAVSAVSITSVVMCGTIEFTH